MKEVKISDYQIAAEAKRVLNQNWIDPGFIFTRSTSGTLAVEGIVKLLNGDVDSVSAQLMDKIDQQLGDIRGVRIIRYRLENMIRVDRTWKKISMKEQKKARVNELDAGAFKGVRSLREQISDKLRKEQEEKARKAATPGTS